MSGAHAAAYSHSPKSAEAFRTISEVATELDVPQHVLRFWESRFAQIRPVKRAGGRRYYRPEDVDLLRGIRGLLYSDGLTIKGVQKVLKDRGLRYVAEIGRGDATLMGGRALDHDGRQAPGAIPPDREGVAAYAALARVHADAVANASSNEDLPDDMLDEEQREKLEILLANLVQMKGRLRAAKPKAQ